MSEKDLNAIVERLDKILFSLQFGNYQTARNYFEVILDSDRKKRVYQLSDGKNSISQIKEKTGIKSQSQIQDWWDEWSRKGIVKDAEEYKGRKIKVIDLKELGLYE